MTATHVMEGKGILVPKGKEWMIPEGAFDAVNKQLGMKLERADKPATMQERPEPSSDKQMKVKDTVTKE